MNYIREIESILTNPENFFQLQFELSENAEEIIITHKKHEKLAFITCFFLSFFFMIAFVLEGISTKQILFLLFTCLVSLVAFYSYLKTLNKIIIDTKLKEIRIENVSSLKKLIRNNRIKFKEITEVKSKYSFFNSRETIIVNAKPGNKIALFYVSERMRSLNLHTQIADTLYNIIKSTH